MEFFMRFRTLMTTRPRERSLLNANSAVAVQRWRTLLQHKIPDFNRLEVLISANRYDGLINLYVTNSLGSKLDTLATSTRLAFIDKFYNITGANLTKLLANDELITYFARYYNDLATRAAFYKLSPTKMLEFLEEYGNASTNIFKKFRAQPRLIVHWDECHVNFLIYRSNIRFLDELHHFKVKDPNAFNHLAFFKSRPKSGSIIYHATGGHTEDIILNGVLPHFVTTNGLKILDPFYLHSINPASFTSARMLNYLQNSKNNTNILTTVGGSQTKLFKYEVNTLANGHKEHRQLLFLMEPQPSTFNENQLVLNGKVYELPKPTHTQYKASWTSDYIKHDMALASMNKQLVSTQSKAASLKWHGQPREWVETTYKSTLFDGSDVTIKHVNHHRYNKQTPFDNHYSYFELD